MLEQLYPPSCSKALLWSRPKRDPPAVVVRDAASGIAGVRRSRGFEQGRSLWPFEVVNLLRIAMKSEGSPLHDPAVSKDALIIHFDLETRSSKPNPLSQDLCSYSGKPVPLECCMCRPGEIMTGYCKNPSQQLRS